MELIARAIRRFRSDGPVHGAAVVRDALFKGSRSAAAHRWIDRHLATIPSDADFFRALGRPVPSTAADLRRAVADLDATLRRRYLPSLSDPATARAIAEHRPDCAAATLRRAEDILAGRFSWLISGYPDGALRWHALIDSPADWPLEPASALDIDSARRPGDVRRIWELSRHQWLGTLARAHLVTGEGRYAEAIGDTLADWIAHNPFGVGVHWLHAQEAALRIRSWLLALAATSRSDAIPPERRLLIYKLLWLHGEYVVRTLSSGATTHNHLITEVAGLLALGVAVPGLRPLRRAALRASATLHAEVLKQFWEEGSPGEGATSYHLFVLESVVEALALRRHAVLPLDDGVRARVLAMLDFARRVVRPDGSVPLIGDADGGRGFRLTDLDDGRDRRGVLAVGALLLGRGDMACGLSQMPEEPAWLLGPAAFDAWRRLRRDEPGQRARLFQCGGFAVLRQDVGVSRSHVVMTAGPTARRIGVSQSHQHCHGLSLTWWLDGEELLVDPGVWLYAGEDRLRAAFRGADAHSGLQLDDRDPFDVTTWRFGVDGQQTADVVEWEGAEDHHRVAFRVPAGPDRSATLERQLLWRPDPGWILLSDAWSGAGVHRTRQWLQVGAVEARTVEGGLALLRDGRLLAHAWWSSELRAELRRGDSPEPGLGLFAPRYGERRDGTTIGLWRDEPLPARRPLLLAPATCGRPVWEEGRLRIPVPGGVDVVRIEAGRAVAVERE